jgi:hypothetical protein
MPPFLSLQQALEFNNAKIKTNRQSISQIRNWYANGYRMHETGTWHNSDGSLKYSTT